MGSEFQSPIYSVGEKLPRPGTWVFVITESYRCMGYLDNKGMWRDIRRQQVIEGVRAWSPASEQETTVWGKVD